MRFQFVMVLVFIFGWHPWCNAQEPLAENLTPAVAHPDKDAFWKGWKVLPDDLLQDQKRIWTFPVSVARGKHLKPTIAFIGVTAGLVALDGYPARYFQKTKSYGQFNKIFSGVNTGKANYLVPLALYGIGLVRRDSYAQKTFLLAGEAVLDSELLTSVMKDTNRRMNPNDVPMNGNFQDTWFKNKFAQNLIGGNGSFPSGHTIAAFSVATVYSDRYAKKHRWVPWLAYGLASLDGFSRMSLKSHFSSEVFAGAALGYVIAHGVVLRPR